MQQIVIFQAELRLLQEMLKWIRERLRGLHGLSTSDKNKFEVASEEVLVNIIQYAYQNSKGNIEIIWKEVPPFIHLTFKDFGAPFNPLKNEKPPIKSLSVDAKDIGGLGIFFIRNFVDKIDYHYKDGANILTISKKIS